MNTVLQQLKIVLVGVLGSKKATAVLAGIVVVLLKATGLDIPEQSVIEILSLIGAYVIGQGIADMGKYKP